MTELQCRTRFLRTYSLPQDHTYTYRSPVPVFARHTLFFSEVRILILSSSFHAILIGKEALCSSAVTANMKAVPFPLCRVRLSITAK